MQIKIANRFRPFSHLAGTTALLPKSNWSVQVFPALVLFKNMLKSQETSTLSLQIKGPVKDFTLEQDLEKGDLCVFGQTEEGYMRYLISREADGTLVQFEKTPREGIACQFLGKEWRVKPKDSLLLPLPSEHSQVEVQKERLSLGVSKQADWDQVLRRQDLAEIFPFWLRLDTLLPVFNYEQSSFGTLALLQECKALKLPAFHKFFLASFRGILVPRLLDEQHQGLGVSSDGVIPANVSPLAVVREGARLIRSLFVQEQEEGIALLKHLPQEFHSGRYTAFRTKNGDLIDLEWSKHLLRRLVFCSAKEQKLHLILQKEIKRFRIRRSERERGQIVKQGEPLPLRAGEKILLDRFEK